MAQRDDLRNAQPALAMIPSSSTAARTWVLLLRLAASHRKFSSVISRAIVASVFSAGRLGRVAPAGRIGEA